MGGRSSLAITGSEDQARVTDGWRVTGDSPLSFK